MDAVNLTTLPSYSATSTTTLTEKTSHELEEKLPKTGKSFVNGTSDAPRASNSPDVTCSSTTPSLPSHSYVSYDGRRYTVFEVRFAITNDFSILFYIKIYYTKITRYVPYSF